MVLDALNDKIDYIDITPAADAASTPATPLNLFARAESSTAVSVNWTDNSDNESGFKVQRSTNGTTWTTIATTNPNAASYYDSGLNAGTLYYYRVLATNATADSAPTAVQSPPPHRRVTRKRRLAERCRCKFRASGSATIAAIKSSTPAARVSLITISPEPTTLAAVQYRHTGVDIGGDGNGGYMVGLAKHGRMGAVPGPYRGRRDLSS